jgi:AraC-like DNA-binding protein
MRPACLALQPYIGKLWATSENTLGHQKSQIEAALPTGRAHIVIRLENSPLGILLSPSDKKEQTFKSSILGGVRSMSYYKNASGASPSVGILLYPGTPDPISGTPAGILSDEHIELELIWGYSNLTVLLDQLNETVELSERLNILENFLVNRLIKQSSAHPAIESALQLMGPFAKVKNLVTRSGLSHRHFIKLFSESVGMTPKSYQRVTRFNYALRMNKMNPILSWADIASESGFTDQSHLDREFSIMAGITPTEYRQLSARSSHHLPWKG